MTMDLLETRKERCMCRAVRQRRVRRLAEPSDSDPSYRIFPCIHPSVHLFFLQVSAAPKSALVSAARPRLGLRAAAALALFIARSKRKADPMSMFCLLLALYPQVHG